MTSEGAYPALTRIIIDTQPIEHVAFDVSYKHNHDIDNMLHKYQCVCGSIDGTLNHITRGNTSLKFYKTMTTAG